MVLQLHVECQFLRLLLLVVVTYAWFNLSCRNVIEPMRASLTDKPLGLMVFHANTKLILVWLVTHRERSALVTRGNALQLKKNANFGLRGGYENEEARRKGRAQKF
jgi:hypothetical protein